MDTNTSVELADLETNITPPSSPEDGFVIELGDIIQLTAPTNPDYDQNTYYVLYVSPTKIKIIDTSTFLMQILHLDEESSITDESITQISILARNPEKGYARQNKLLPNTWIDVHIGGELPDIITGEITNLEEDMIEITTYPKIQVIYINFEYRGIPEHIPIEKIVIREKPLALKHTTTLAISEKENTKPHDEMTQEEIEKEESEREKTNGLEDYYAEEQEIIPVQDVIQHLNELILEYDDILEEQLETFVQEVEVKESEKRYTLDAQLTDMSEKLLSGIPFHERTNEQMEHIRFLLDKYKWLRNHFSIFDENGTIVGHRMVGTMHKPLVNEIARLTKRLRWLLPVVKHKRKLFKPMDKRTAGEDYEKINEINEMEDSLYPDAILRFENIAISEDIERIEMANKGIIGDALRYDMIGRATAQMIQPFENLPTVSSAMNNEQNRFLVQNKEVEDTFEAIVSNFENMYTSVRNAKTNMVDRRRMVIQRYSLGDYKNEIDAKNGLRVFTKKKMVENDRITIQSFVKLPEPFIRFSKVSSPCTDILTRSQLSQTGLYLYKFLKDKTKIKKHIIDDLNMEINYSNKDGDNDAIKTDHFFTNTIKEYILAKDIDIDHDTLRNMVYSIIPKTNDLIEYLEKYIQDKISLVEVVKLLDPFSIYDEDISWKHYEHIVKFSREYIKTHKIMLNEKHEEYLKLKNADFETPKLPSIFTNDKNGEFIQDTYQLNVEEESSTEKKSSPKVSDTEILRKILEIDGGHLYSKIINLSLLHLVTPEKILNMLESIDKASNAEKTEEEINFNDCSRRLLAKRYFSFDDIKKDDGKQIDDMGLIWDQDLDSTPYATIKKYAKQKSEMSPVDFMEFLVETLIEKHNVSEGIASRIAEDLIRGKRVVREGEYAQLTIKPTLPDSQLEKDMDEKELKEIELESELKKRVYYYRRIKGNWIRDDNIESEAFMNDSNLVCNIENTSKLGKMDNSSLDEKRASLMRTFKEKMLKEFDTRWNLSIEDMKKSLETDIENLKHAVFKKKNLQYVQLYKPNILAYHLGKFISQSSEKKIESPHAELRDQILAQPDFPTKQRNIIKFVDKYTREPLPEESPHWMYCVDTNIKLFPISLFTLAKAFVYNDDYSYILDKVCAEVGEVVENVTVDKHSGYILRLNAFINAEEYDENGHLKITNSIIETDELDLLQEKLSGKTLAEVKEDETTQMLTNVYTAISSNLGIHSFDQEIKPFVIRIAYELVNNPSVILTEEMYEEKMKKKEEKRAKMTYETYRNQNILCILAGTILISVQTAIPEITKTRTFPGCIRSFEGYPVGEGEDKGGLTYISCVMNDIKSNISPWNSILKIKSDGIAKGISMAIDKFLINRSEIQDRIKTKRDYIITHPKETTIPDEVNVTKKWVGFLPPIVPVNKDKSSPGITVEFEKDLMQTISQAHKTQNEKIRAVNTRLTKQSFSIFEMINEIISTKNLLMLTVSTNTPYKENACCNDGNPKETALEYFIKENPNISASIAKTGVMEKLLRATTLLARPGLMYHPERTAIRYVDKVPQPNSLFDNQRHIYAAFIHYCNFENDLPIPDEFLVLCSSKPRVGYPLDEINKDYDKTKLLDRKIEFLKSIGVNFTKTDALHLMSIVNRRNYLKMDKHRNLSPESRFTDVLNGLLIQDADSVYKIDIQHKKLFKHLYDIVEDYSPNKPLSERRTTLYALYRELKIFNKKMYEDITNFINDHGNLKNTEYQNVSKYLWNISNWKSSKETEIDNDSFCNYTNFIKNIIRNLTVVYPKIIENFSILVPETGSTRSHLLCKHWKLAPSHKDYLLKELDSIKPQFSPFASNEAVLRLLVKLNMRIQNFMLLVNNTPFNYSIFDRSTEVELMKYYIFSIFTEYIQLTTDDEIIGFVKNESLVNRKLEIDKNKETSNLLRAMYPQNSLNVEEYEQELDTVLNLYDVDFAKGDEKAMKITIAKLMTLYINIIEKDKGYSNTIYADIKHNMSVVKGLEKTAFTSFIGKFTKEELQLNKTSMKYKIGRYNIGEQKGLYSYDIEYFEKDKNNEIMIQALAEEEEFSHGVKYEMPGEDTMDIEDLDRSSRLQLEEEADREAYDISGLGEDYMDGSYYDEDMSDEW